ncbi:MAG: hypothetical protein QOF89_661 [Acidobacteriota bacterium]|jgi:hypothetical protein|nr:hypothetical protein [Acidobacteriota bacterium]
MTVAPPLPPQPQSQSASTQAITALVLGIIGVICCGLAAPFAWYFGNQELRAILAGTSPAAGEGMAKAGKILGIIGTILLILSILWIFFMGGMAVLQGMSNR